MRKPQGNSRATGRPKTGGERRGGRPAAASNPGESTLRIVGGNLRGRRIKYSGDTTVRPMKDRTREAMFNLIGPTIVGKHVFDLFAGTGAIAIEALSRGASSATLIERHFPTARIVRDNLRLLGLEDRSSLVTADAFFWSRQKVNEFPQLPWAVFCSPPYRFYTERLTELTRLLAGMLQAAPPSSLFVVEAMVEFDFTSLVPGIDWEQRAYPPALLGLHYPGLLT
jgi:16S rRNA (guanine966-N2)-methyltransferase